MPDRDFGQIEREWARAERATEIEYRREQARAEYRVDYGLARFPRAGKVERAGPRILSAVEYVPPYPEVLIVSITRERGTRIHHVRPNGASALRALRLLNRQKKAERQQ